MTLRILLVDDHQMMREGLRAILEKVDGYSVVGEAGSGREAVRMVREISPDIVVMDVAMSDMNGIEATREIRANAPATQVVALSSYSDRRYVTAILDAGACAYVLKADAYDELQRAVEAASKRMKYLCAGVTSEVIESALERGLSGSVYDLLAPREREVLQLLAEGLTSPEMAKRLSIAISTIETHRGNIMRKLDVHNVAELTKYAIREGMTSLEVGSPRVRD